MTMPFKILFGLFVFISSIIGQPTFGTKIGENKVKYYIAASADEFESDTFDSRILFQNAYQWYSANVLAQSGTTSSQEDEDSRDILDIVESLTGLLIPVVIALVGHWYTSALKEKEIEAKYIEIAISALDSESTESNQNIRKWAVEIINKYSPVEIDEATRKEIFERLQIYRGFNEHLQGISNNQKLTQQIFFTRGWLAKFSLKVSNLKKMLSDAGYFKGDVNNEDLNKDLIDAITSFQKINDLDPVDGIFGEISYAKLRELNVSKQ